MSVITHFLSKSPINTVHTRRTRRFAAVVAASLAILGGGSIAHAQTTGLQIPDTGDVILARLGFIAGQQPSDFDDNTPTFIDFNGVTFNYIANPYMAVVQGVNGTFGVSYDEGQFVGDAITLDHNSPGMLSFGNLGGSLRITNDNKRALNGFNYSDYYGTSQQFRFFGGGIPAGYGVWPLPGYWDAPAFALYDYSAYVSTVVDGLPGNNGTVTGGTFTQVVGNDENWIIEPTFRSNAILNQNDPNRSARGNFLLSEAEIGNDCILRQEVRLFRNTAQMRWVVRNEDTVSHTVYLKFVVNHRAAQSLKVDFATGTSSNLVDPAFFYTDPSQGPTIRSQIYGQNPDGTIARNVPGQIDVLGSRYQADTSIVEPYHGRHILNEYGATLPASVYVGDSENLYPDGNPFSPQRSGIRYDKIEDGVAVAVYFQPITVGPGATSSGPDQEIITYYGNGDSTDRLEADFAIGTEAEESFQYNAGAANTLNQQQIGNPTFSDTARQFLSPQRLDIYGSVYNRQLSESQFDVILKDVRMSVTLPDALRFATSSVTGLPDTPTKNVGDIPGDTDRVAQWIAEPTGALFGTYFYQMTATVSGITPLSRTVNRPISIPATPLYNVSDQYYQMIGFPFDFDRTLTNNNDTRTIFDGLSVPKGTNPADYILYRWVPDPDSVDGNGRYQIATTIDRGEGYFFRPGIARTLFLYGARPDTQATPLQPGTRVQYFQKVLERGWNMITNPWVYGVPVSFISLADIDNNDPDADLNLTYFPDAVQSGLVRGGIFFYNPDRRAYDFFQDFTQELRPYQAYWVFVEDRKILRIATPSQKQSALIPAPDGSIPVTQDPTRKRKVGAIESGRAFPTTQTAQNWKMQLIAKRVGPNASDTANDSMTLLGVSPNAKDGDDTRDLPKPPPVMNDYVSVSILHEVKSGKTRAFAQDLKAPGGKKEWVLEVESDRDGPVSLAWPNLSRLPKTVNLTLTDKATGRKTAMRSTSSLVLNVSARTKSRFVITADRGKTQPLAFTSVRFKDEGSRGPNGGANYSLSFKTTADAQVEARIVTQSGKTVSNLAAGRAVTTNENVRLQWNGRSQDGNRLPAGSYIVELMARGEDGEIATAKRPITTAR
ncbi:MAG: hypothetical protein H8F28_01285 [Fibrella sp.]|nr:hypothetical protein [Armatimonadota bacterium]